MTTHPADPPKTSAATMTRDNYKFPSHRLLRQQRTDRTPVVLVACGSFSPINNQHIRMFGQAVRYTQTHPNANLEIVGSYLSPVSDKYGKSGLESGSHRVRMCELAADDEGGSKLLMVDPWEAVQPEYTPTAEALDHFDQEINGKLDGILTKDGSRRIPVHIMLLGGSDLLTSMASPGVWDQKDVDHILKDYGAIIVERVGEPTPADVLNDPEYKLHKTPPIKEYGESSTIIRSHRQQGMAIKALTPKSVIDYIETHHLWAPTTV
ncbi:Uu.00g126690.m01.CDS01 [Anthostomella pinea]|uniref:Nicotinamide-nucleotide adenylyltransferase n=1 Tax=Anthostomella pinea TaxID=933095 RepID=A0AAI8VIY2_9PEZI|nr:Uu.00g126690.m01.CDS01 [Anthostomella pinea]